MFGPTSPVGFLLMVLQTRLDRAHRSERGASAVEWVVIAAIVVGVCILVGGILRIALEGKANDIGDQIQGS